MGQTSGGKNKDDAILHLRQALRVSNIGFWEWNPDKNAVYFSPEWKRQIGYQEDELINHFGEWESRLHPDDRERVLNRVTSYIEDPKGAYQIEFRFRHKDGTYRWILAQASMVKDGKDQKLVGSHIDITEQKRAQEAFRQSEERFRNMVEGAPDPIFIELNGHFAYLNPKALVLFGASSEAELLGKPVLEVFHQDFHESISNRIFQLNEERKAVSTPMGRKVIGLDNREIWVETTGEPVLFDGQPGGLVFIRDISRRKLIEMSLQQERQRLENIISGTRAGTWEWNVETGETRFNERWAEMIGYTLDELSPVSINTWKKYTHPEDLQKSMEILQQYLAGNLEYYECEMRMKHKDGHWIWVVDRGKVINRGEGGNPLIMYGTHLEITEQKEALKELDHSHQLMKYIIEHEKSGIAVHDRDLNYIYVSKRYLDQYKIKERDIIGKHHYEVFPEIPEKWRKIHQRALNGEVISADEDPFKRADGSVEWTRWECRPWYESDDKIGGIIIYTEVITDRKQKEMEIFKLNNQLEILINAVKALSSAQLMDVVRKIATTAARELTGADGATFVLLEGDQCFYAEENAISPLWKGQRFPVGSCISGWTISHKKTVIIEDIYTDKRIAFEDYQQTFVKSLMMVPISQNSPVGTIGVYWSRKHVANSLEIKLIETLADAAARAIDNINLYAGLEARVEERTRQLEKVNKELETFTYSVSHDLKAPLRGIDGYSKLLHNQYGEKLDEEARFFISTIRKSTLQMNELIDDLLNYSRLERSEMRNVVIRIRELVDSIANIYGKEFANRKISVFNEVPAIEIMADSRAMTIVLRNLLENAIKFSKGKTGDRIEIGLNETTTSWILYVKDNGVGFDMKYQHRIFEIFQRLHRAEDYPGTGIGLAMVSKAVQRMQGKAWAEGKPGEGAAFFIEIPKDIKTTNQT